METDALANSIVKALAYTENGGKPDIFNPQQGKTGEMKSIFQFTPNTWKQYAKKYLKDEKAPMTADSETYVAKERVKQWISEGKTARQIASMWNAGENEPNAYTGKFSTGKSSKGVNQKYGVKFDVPEYANRVLNYSKKFYTEKSIQDAAPIAGGTSTSANPDSSINTTTPQSTAPKDDPASALMSMIKSVPSKDAMPGLIKNV